MSSLVGNMAAKITVNITTITDSIIPFHFYGAFILIKNSNGYSYSPSDLTLYMHSPFASWMARFAIERPDELPVKDKDDALMGLLQQRGYAHEDALEAEFISEGRSLVKIEGGSNEDKRQATLEAMQAGVDVIVQARLENAPFAGFADFLIKTDGASDLGNYHYEVWDTKLSSSLKSSFVIQLCCYAQMLEAIQGVRPANISVALGNGKLEVLRTADYYYYYQAIKQSFVDDQAHFSPSSMPDPADSKNWGSWSSYAESILLEREHLFQVATITRSQIKKLNAAGIDCVQQLIDSSEECVRGFTPTVFQRLKAQAAIQQASQGKSAPLFKVLPNTGDKQGLALLPPHSAQDVFFDIEGFPLDEGGLEYLWGNTYFDEQGNRQFKDFWAHNAEQEKQCFEDFIGWVYQRWQRDPTMHIYHYANYEIAACRKLMGRYGVCEYEVDQLLRNEVFVDLYKVVKGGILLGEPRYSIKNVEHLYRGKRDTEVGTGGDSVVVYEQWRELHARGEQGDTWQTSKILNDIRDYNIDDCDSTQELVDWLREQQQQHGIAYLGKTELVEVEESAEITERTELRDRLLTRAEAERNNNDPMALVTENLAWMLEFHRREAKPVFWKLFDRLGMEEEQLLDDLDCLALCLRTEREPYKIKRSLGYEYSFDPSQEFKGASNSYYVLGEETEEGKSVKVSIEKDDSDFANGRFVVKAAKAVPSDLMTLVPDEYVRPQPIPEAITAVVAAYEQGQLGQCAIVDFLARAKPRIIGHKVGTAIADGSTAAENLQQIIDAISRLDNSYLPIQGPPGAGKSYTGKHVIAELMRQGKKVGICSNSHKAINNLLAATAQYCNQQGIDAAFMCTRDTGQELAAQSVEIGKNADLESFVQDACVVGTTAWGFAREDMVSSLDYLFVDEAGQVSVANLIAISRSADNLVLMGDQMQLGQPTQGTHPADSGASILDYLLHHNPTIAADHGVFLGTTYRMHSAVNAFISEAVYDNKLHSDPANDRQTVAVPADYVGPLDKPAGVMFVPVEHQGNTQASDEEIAAIVTMAEQLHGRIFTSKDNVSREVGWADMLFVAPYNFQVKKLTEALAQLPNGEQARVGSVDKFQGQEAPIVFLSMCASDASESPRGMDFLFDKNRLNVAISRAQSLAIVVANPHLAITPTNNVKQLAKVNMFSQLASYAQ